MRWRGRWVVLDLPGHGRSDRQDSYAIGQYAASVARAALPHMVRQKSGHIINVSSVAGHKVRPGSAVYSATKHAVRALSEGLRQEVTPHGIRTTIISPGAVATELTDSITEEDVRQMSKAYVAEIAVPPESFARCVAFAIGQPEELDINEILFRPTKQEY